IGRVVIPRAPAHFSASGMLMADVRRDFVLTHFARLAEIDMAELESLYRTLEEEALASLRSTSVRTTDIVFERAADMRYVGQEHAVALPVPAHVGSEDARAAIHRAFNDAHQLRFSHSAPEEPVELVSLRVSVVGRIAKPPTPRLEPGESNPPGEAQRPRRRLCSTSCTGPGSVSSTIESVSARGTPSSARPSWRSRPRLRCSGRETSPASTNTDTWSSSWG